MNSISKILYIDCISPRGHINFNEIQLNKLSLKYKHIDCVFKEGYFDALCISSNINLKLAIPLKYYTNGNKITNRINFSHQLYYLKANVNFKNYDLIIFGSYDTITLSLYNFNWSNVILINHRNINDLKDCIKSLFLKWLSRRVYKMAVFNKTIANTCELHGIHNTLVLNHGLPKALDNIKLIKYYSIRQEFSRIIFSPSISYDEKLMEQITSDPTVLSYLKDNNILLILKERAGIVSSCDNIKVVKPFLDIDEYNELFYYSDIILLAYPLSFDDCVSGVLSEVIANNKFCMCSKIKPFEIIEQDLPYRCCFSDSASFINVCSSILMIKSLDYNKSNYESNWDSVKL